MPCFFKAALWLVVAWAAGPTNGASAASAGGPSAREPAPAPSDYTFEILLRLQIFLDAENFGPGQIDGKAGEFTRKAVAAWNVANGYDDTEDWRPALRQSQRRVNALYAAYRIKAGDLAFLSPKLPEKPADQAALDYLGYRSLAEFVAERYHTSEGSLARLNPGQPLATLRAGEWLKVPNVEPFRLEELRPQQAWNANNPLSARSVLVDTDQKTASFYDEDGYLFASFPITPGQTRFVPLGEWKMEVMLALPQYRWDKQMLEQGKRSKNASLLPAGPNSPVGVMWAGLNKSGIGLHGTATPETIGRSRSAGCIRFANWDAVRLPSLVRPGSRVLIK
ncbi:MAG: L,D-transpeptidase [Verrucomicrobiales bacterium]